MADKGDEYAPAPARQVGALGVTISGNRATLTRAAHRWLLRTVSGEEAFARVRWLLKRDGSGFALEATTDRKGSYSLKSHRIQVAPSVVAWATDDIGTTPTADYSYGLEEAGNRLALSQQGKR